jgi:hypothetical protein
MSSSFYYSSGIVKEVKYVLFSGILYLLFVLLGASMVPTQALMIEG